MAAGAAFDTQPFYSPEIIKIDYVCRLKKSFI